MQCNAILYLDTSRLRAVQARSKYVRVFLKYRLIGQAYFIFTLDLRIINHSLRLARKHSRIFVLGHYLFLEAHSFP